jgi:hypothetical protein
MPALPPGLPPGLPPPDDGVPLPVDPGLPPLGMPPPGMLTDGPLDPPLMLELLHAAINEAVPSRIADPTPARCIFMTSMLRQSACRL